VINLETQRERFEIAAALNTTGDDANGAGFGSRKKTAARAVLVPLRRHPTIRI